MEEFWSRISAAIPLVGLATFVTQYTDLLHVPYLTHPDWANYINLSIRPLGVVGLLLSFIILYRVNRQRLWWVSIVLLASSVILMIICYWYSDTLDAISDQIAAQKAIMHWKWLYMAACTLLVLGATVASLWIVGSHSNEATGRRS